jgi:hypothetical protein
MGSNGPDHADRVVRGCLVGRDKVVGLSPARRARTDRAGLYRPRVVSGNMSEVMYLYAVADSDLVDADVTDVRAVELPSTSSPRLRSRRWSAP